MFRFTPRQIPNKIFVIGCGGTGSRLVPLLAQFIRSITKKYNPQGWLVDPIIYLIDDDVVEQKNLLRQNFIDMDVGKHKASVLAQRYGRAYGVNMIPVTRRIKQGDTNFLSSVPSHIEGKMGTSFMNSMTILCVDSVQARKDILGVMRGTTYMHVKETSQAPFVIDAGNEDNFGQVRFFNLVHWYGYPSDAKNIEFPALIPCTMDIDHIPYDHEFYMGMQEGKGTGSCADLDQTLAINAIMSTTIMGIVQNFYYVKPMTFNQISISLDGGSLTTYNTPRLFANMVSAVDLGMLRIAGTTQLAQLRDKAVSELEAMSTKTEPKVEEAPKKPRAKKTPKITNILENDMELVSAPITQVDPLVIEGVPAAV